MSQLTTRTFAKVKLESQPRAKAGGDAEPVGRLVDSSQADDRKMIRLVRERRLLYARNNMPVASYHSQVKQLWQEVANKMGWTVADVRRKWSHIRNSYSRHLRNEMHGAITAKGRTVSRWYLADELAFLREHMATDTHSSPYSTYTPTRFLELDMAEAADVKPFLPAWPGRAPRLDDDSSSSAFDPDENSSYFQFFRGLHPDYQELSARRQRQFKRQCLSFLHMLLDEEDATAEEARIGGEGSMNMSSAHVSDEDEGRLCVVSGVCGGGDAQCDVLPD